MSLSRVPPVPTWDADHEKRAMSEEPIRFIYSHLHDRIRHELTSLSALCGGLRGSDLVSAPCRKCLSARPSGRRPGRPPTRCFPLAFSDA